MRDAASRGARSPTFGARSPSFGARAAWAVGLALGATLASPGPALAAVALLVVASFVASRRITALVRLLPSALALAAFAVVVNACLTKGAPLFPSWPWSPSREGLALGATLAARLALTALAFAWLAATSEVAAVLDALRSGPLARLGRAGDRLGLVALVALRFGPLVAEEAGRLVRAVSMRAGRRPGPWAAPAIAVPLVLTAVRRADRLAYVLEARHYGSGPRTPPAGARAGWRDVGLACAGAAVVVLALVAR
jgi:energy-coupling factor transporter transmembrane protein EcfT